VLKLQLKVRDKTQERCGIGEVVVSQHSSDIDLSDELKAVIEKGWKLREQINQAMGNLKAQITATLHYAPDAEMGEHALWLRQLKEIINGFKSQIDDLDELSKRRMFHVLVSRESDGFIALGKKFRIDGELLPTCPKKNTVEYDELVAWIKNSEHKEAIQEEIVWKRMKKVCEDLAEKGKPFPPHVKKSPKVSLRIS
jgi:hypothetical protein